MDKLLNSSQHFITNNINSNIIVVKPVPIKQFNSIPEFTQDEIIAANAQKFCHGFTNAKRIRRN